LTHHFIQAMSGSTHSRPGNIKKGNRSIARKKKRYRSTYGMAI